MAPLNLFRQSSANSASGSNPTTGFSSSSSGSTTTSNLLGNSTPLGLGGDLNSPTNYQYRHFHQSPQTASTTNPSPSKYNPTRLLRRKASVTASSARTSLSNARTDGPLTGSSTSSSLFGGGSEVGDKDVFADAQAQRLRGSLGAWTDDEGELETVVILGPSSERHGTLTPRLTDDKDSAAVHEDSELVTDYSLVRGHSEGLIGLNGMGASSFSLRPITPPLTSQTYPTALSPPRRPGPSPRTGAGLSVDDASPRSRRADFSSSPPPPSRPARSVSRRRSSYDHDRNSTPPPLMGRQRTSSPTWSSADERTDRRREENAAWLARKPSLTRNRKKSFSALNASATSAPATPNTRNHPNPTPSSLGPSIASLVAAFPLPSASPPRTSILDSTASISSVPSLPPVHLSIPPVPPIPATLAQSRLEPPASLRHLHGSSSQESEAEVRGYEVEVACVDRREDGEMRWEVVVRRAEAVAPSGPYGPVHVPTAGSIALAPPGASSINLSLALDQPTGKLVFVSFPMELGATPSASRQKLSSRSETPPQMNQPPPSTSISLPLQSQLPPSSSSSSLASASFIAPSHVTVDVPPSPRSPRTQAYKRQAGLWSPSPGHSARQSSTDNIYTSDVYMTPKRMQSLVSDDREVEAMNRLVGAVDTVDLTD